jgi:hypothetical protein
MAYKKDGAIFNPLRLHFTAATMTGGCGHAHPTLKEARVCAEKHKYHVYLRVPSPRKGYTQTRIE